MPVVAILDPQDRCTGVAEFDQVPDGLRHAVLPAWDDSVIGKTALPGGQWAAAPAPQSPTQWLIDIGPFFDRFGAARLAVLSSADPVVRALVLDTSVRKWVDLQRVDVAAGIDALIAASVPGVTSQLKAAILTTPVAAHENEALRRLYFA